MEHLTVKPRKAGDIPSIGIFEGVGKIVEIVFLIFVLPREPSEVGNAVSLGECLPFIRCVDLRRPDQNTRIIALTIEICLDGSCILIADDTDHRLFKFNFLNPDGLHHACGDIMRCLVVQNIAQKCHIAVIFPEISFCGEDESFFQVLLPRNNAYLRELIENRTSIIRENANPHCLHFINTHGTHSGAILD